jgi:signal transduction histidine kinase
VVATDVTKLVQLEESVRQSERLAAMGSLTAGVAHEVRNPLFAISANVDALGAVLGERIDVAELLDAVRGEVSRLGRLMEDLLAYGRSTPARMVERPICDAVELALRSCEPQPRSAGIRLEPVELSRSLVVCMDIERIAQALDNLLENAIQHAPHGSAVRIAIESFTEAGRPWVRCTVADTGPGFREDDQPRIFEPFFTRRRGGTGLGLSIAQRYVQQHGGRLFARNRERGGALVVLDLPRIEAPGS